MEKFMKHITLITSLFFCTLHTSHAMDITLTNNDKPSPALQMCIEGINKKNAKLVQQGLLAGADVNYTNKDGQSLFYLACATDNKDIFLPIVMHHNIDLLARTSDGYTPLYLACEFGLTETVESMLCKNPQLATRRCKRGSIPLHITSYHGHEDCINLLLTHNNNTLNWQNYYGSTALHLACQEKKDNVITPLILNSADTTIKTNQQITPLFLLYSNIKNSEWNKFNTFIADNSSVANKLIHITDKHNNNQFHLCATIQNIADAKLDKYLLFLSAQRLDKNARNDDGKRAVDLACEECNTLYNSYITKKSPDIYKILTYQERVMHAFLRFTSPDTQCALFQHLLQQQSASSIQLPKEVQSFIACLYYTLNIETIIAKKYNGKLDYYNDFIENKIEIKKQLLAKPEPTLLWKNS